MSGPPPRDRAAVVCFHGVTERPGDPERRPNQLTVGSFLAQVEQLARERELLSLPRLAELLRSGRPLGTPKGVVTFDDGYRNVLTVAQPLLRDRGVPFATFVCTRNAATGERLPTDLLRAALWGTRERAVRLDGPGLGELSLAGDAQRRAAVAAVTVALKRSPWAAGRALLAQLAALLGDEPVPPGDDDAPLTWEEVAELARTGTAIGSHGHEHVILHDAQPPAEIARQLRRSKWEIEERIGPCLAFAYPNGGRADIAPAAERAARACGYELAFAATPALVDRTSPRMRLPRLFAAADAPGLQRRLVAAATPAPEPERA